ncbi:VOC family protein [Salinarimonas soli]|uniref:Glyoxalase n=1 Tax=Salinarimonas soli TaxID=1638099 RepID=A0A5B2VWR2_9HYPH|nr:VOC family protein [Salinarimonas soli]KAA2244273.1 glyoxalase [Salinarimonas soli]
MSELDTVLDRPALASQGQIDMKLEVVVIPVSDVDRAKQFYRDIGWRLDSDFVVGDDFRLIQFTPPGSPCSIHIGHGITPAAPGSARGLYLVVSDIEAARAELIRRGADVSEIFHQWVGETPMPGPDPSRRSYHSYATFSDPDGNQWLLQEITTRFPGRIDATATSFASTADLAAAMRRASAAHDTYEKSLGTAHANWPDWYAEHMAAEQSGADRPA